MFLTTIKQCLLNQNVTKYRVSLVLEILVVFKENKTNCSFLFDFLS